MKIACTCEACGNIFMQEDDDICLEINFKTRIISFICRNKKCKHENILDLGVWKNMQNESPLPKIRTM